MKRRIHILLACMLALQPVMPLWAAGGGCDMAQQMHSVDDSSTQAPCEDCSDCCGETDCAMPCLALGFSPIALASAMDIRHIIVMGDFRAPDSDQIPAGHASPALRPPIAL